MGKFVSYLPVVFALGRVIPGLDLLSAVMFLLPKTPSRLG